MVYDKQGGFIPELRQTANGALYPHAKWSEGYDDDQSIVLAIVLHTVFMQQPFTISCDRKRLSSVVGHIQDSRDGSHEEMRPAGAVLLCIMEATVRDGCLLCSEIEVGQVGNMAPAALVGRSFSLINR